jgi:hypothetical protein
MRDLEQFFRRCHFVPIVLPPNKRYVVVHLHLRYLDLMLRTGLVRGGSSSVTLLTPHPIWDHLLRCQPAIAHDVFDLGPAQTDVG